MSFSRYALILGLTLAACSPRAPAPEDSPPPVAGPETPEPPPDLHFTATDFEAMAGWAEADLRPALAAFRRSCTVWRARPADAPAAPRAPIWGRVSDWLPVCDAMPPEGADAQTARAFFAGAFTPFRASAGPDAEETGMLTGYYEPELEVARTQTPEFSAPLLTRPADLVRVDLGVFDADLAGQQIVGKVEGGALVPYDPRAAIGPDRAPAMAWARPVDAFFLQVQGSGLVRYPDGARSRAAFAAHNGLPYRSIGSVLIERGEMTADTASKQNIEAWVAEAGPEAATELFNQNPRYVFFAPEPAPDPGVGPRGAQGAPLGAMASIAVDPAYHPYGLPVWLRASLPAEGGDWLGQDTALLVVAQDTGGAITGPLRADLFFGTGAEAGARAGVTRAQARWTVLVPSALAERLLDPVS